MNDEERWVLVDEILEAEEISDELFKKIGRVLAKKKVSPEEKKVDTLSDVIRQSKERQRSYKESRKGRILASLQKGQPIGDYDAEIKTLIAKTIALNPSYLEEKKQRREKTEEKDLKQAMDATSREIIDDLEKEIAKFQKEAGIDIAVGGTEEMNMRESEEKMDDIERRSADVERRSADIERRSADMDERMATKKDWYRAVVVCGIVVGVFAFIVIPLLLNLFLG